MAWELNTALVSAIGSGILWAKLKAVREIMLGLDSIKGFPTYGESLPGSIKSATVGWPTEAL